VQRNSELFELDHKELNKKFWKLSFKGNLYIETEIKKFNELEREKLLLKEAKKYELPDYDFENGFNEIINGLNLKDQILRDEQYITLDFKELSEVNPFYVIFLEKYELLKEKFVEYVKNNFDKIISIRPINLPESDYVSLLDLSSSSNLNKLIKTTGVIEYRSDTKEGILQSLILNVEVVDQLLNKHDGEMFKEPRRCSCGIVIT